MAQVTLAVHIIPHWFGSVCLGSDLSLPMKSPSVPQHELTSFPQDLSTPMVSSSLPILQGHLLVV